MATSYDAPAESSENTDAFGILEGRTGTEEYTPSEKDRELLAKLDSAFIESYRQRQYVERKWETASFYLKGQTFARNRTTGFTTSLIFEGNQKLLSTFNVLRPTAR